MKPGDKVRIIKQGPIDFEKKDWLKIEYQEMGLSYPNDTAVIEEVLLALDGVLVKLEGGAYYLHPDHFEVISNSDKIAKQMKIKGKELQTLRQWLWECSDIKGQKFAYAILKNRKLVDKLSDELFPVSKVERDTYKAMEKSVKYKKYEEKVQKLEMKFGDKGANGGNLIIGNKTVIIAKKKEFEKALEELNEKNKDVIEKRKKQTKDFEDKMEKQIEVNFFMIKPEDISDEITANQLDGISLLLV